MISEQPKQFDFFISHAGEDTEVAVAIEQGLLRAGYRVWLDKGRLTVGDRLLRVINDGISRTHYAVVLLSPAFFAKNWPQWELEGLAAVEDAENRKVILPVWHALDKQMIAGRAPILAARYAAETRKGIETVVSELIAALNADRQRTPDIQHPLTEPVPPPDDDEPGAVDFFADAEEGYETGSKSLNLMVTSMTQFTQRATAFNARIAELTQGMRDSGRGMSWKVLRNTINEVVPIFDDHAKTLTAESGRMRAAFAKAFLSVARGFAMESTPGSHEARIKHAATVAQISQAALGAAQMMENIRGTLDGLQGHSSEMKKARRRLLAALDEQIAAIYGVIDDAKDARALLLRSN